MQKSTWILALVWVLALLASPLYAGHSFSNPMRTTGDGDFYALGGLDVDGTCMLDGAATFNAGMTGDDLTLSGTLSVGGAMSLTDSLYVTGNVVFGDSLYVTDDLTVGDDFKVAGELAGARVWLPFANGATSQTIDLWLRSAGNMGTTAAQGLPAPVAGSVRGYSTRYYINSFTPGAYAVTRFYVDGAKTFADSFYIDATGWHGDQDTFARDTHTFAAGDHFSAQVDINGTVTYGAPAVIMDLQLDD